MGEFREVVHEWARRQLEQGSDHTGPFRVVSVWLDHEMGSSISSESTEVHIGFVHDGSTCTSWRPPGDQTPCPDTGTWFMPGTRKTVQVLNELLAIADET